MEKGKELSIRERRPVIKLEKPLWEIVKVLGPKIESGIYSAVIGEDASGRVPTLILAAVIKNICREKNIRSPLVRFIAGAGNGYPKKIEAVSRHIGKVKKETERKGWPSSEALLVTEFIESGYAITPLVNGFKENDWDIDIATVGIAYKEHFEETYRERAVGGSKDLPDIYGRHEYGGVMKKQINLFSERTYKKKIPKKVKRTRVTVEQVADRIYAKYVQMKKTGI